MENPSLASKEQGTQVDVVLNKDQPDSLSRLKKGYNYEFDIWSMLDAHGIDYESNPQTFSEWLKHTGTNYDVKVETVKKGWVRVECKFISKPIYNSWFMRDWYPRDCDVIVTPCKWYVPYEDRKLLRGSGRKLLETHEFLNYILKLCKKGNKYRVFEYPKTVNKPRKTDLFSVKLSPLAKTGGVLMAKDEDSYDKFTWYCEQCCRYEKNCKIIEDHEWNRLRFYTYLQRPKHKHTTLSENTTEEEDLAEFIKLYDEWLRSLDLVLKCLRKRNYLHGLYLKNKMEYPCFYEHQELS